VGSRHGENVNEESLLRQIAARLSRPGPGCGRRRQ
jgi:hypothetical protein